MRCTESQMQRFRVGIIGNEDPWKVLSQKIAQQRQFGEIIGLAAIISWVGDGESEGRQLFKSLDLKWQWIK